MSTAVAIEWALAPASVPQPFSVRRSLRSLRAGMQTRSFRRRHPELARAIDAAAEEIASTVLAAQDRAEVEVAVDEQATNRSLIRVVEGLFRLQDSPTLRRLAQEEPRIAAWEWLGAAPTKHMALGGFYANQVALALAGAIERNGREFIESLRGAPSDDLLSFLTHHNVHVDVAEALLATYRSFVCLLVLGGARRLGRWLEPWLALDLAERFAHGQRQQLRLLASVPGFSVPEDVIPASERFDLDKLTAEARAADERLRTMKIDPDAYVE